MTRYGKRAGRNNPASGGKEASESVTEGPDAPSAPRPGVRRSVGDISRGRSSAKTRTLYWRETERFLGPWESAFGNPKLMVHASDGHLESVWDHGKPGDRSDPIRGEDLKHTVT